MGIRARVIYDGHTCEIKANGYISTILVQIFPHCQNIVAGEVYIKDHFILSSEQCAIAAKEFFWAANSVIVTDFQNYRDIWDMRDLWRAAFLLKYQAEQGLPLKWS